jgi:hypothetical protein
MARTPPAATMHFAYSRAPSTARLSIESIHRAALGAAASYILERRAGGAAARAGGVKLLSLPMRQKQLPSRVGHAASEERLLKTAQHACSPRRPLGAAGLAVRAPRGRRGACQGAG